MGEKAVHTNEGQQTNQHPKTRLGWQESISAFKELPSAFQHISACSRQFQCLREATNVFQHQHQQDSPNTCQSALGSSKDFQCAPTPTSQRCNFLKDSNQLQQPSQPKGRFQAVSPIPSNFEEASQRSYTPQIFLPLARYFSEIFIDNVIIAIHFKEVE